MRKLKVLLKRHTDIDTHTHNVEQPKKNIICNQTF